MDCPPVIKIGPSPLHSFMLNYSFFTLLMAATESAHSTLLYLAVAKPLSKSKSSCTTWIFVNSANQIYALLGLGSCTDQDWLCALAITWINLLQSAPSKIKITDRYISRKNLRTSEIYLTCSPWLVSCSCLVWPCYCTLHTVGTSTATTLID